jgi:hypothetical protein
MPISSDTCVPQTREEEEEEGESQRETVVPGRKKFKTQPKNLKN